MGTFYDLTQLIYTHEQMGKTNVKIRITPRVNVILPNGGPRIQRIFGKSTIHEINNIFDPSAFSGNLEDWRMVPKQQYKISLIISLSPSRPEINKHILYADLDDTHHPGV